mmetsp:Transcript_14979/g.22437  ORF Transcript_14979/g.22437 Transcript_14979/m.22437 type:complete len:84 (+) Transcript_14979:180-431(+)
MIANTPKGVPTLKALVGLHFVVDDRKSFKQLVNFGTEKFSAQVARHWLQPRDQFYPAALMVNSRLKKMLEKHYPSRVFGEDWW